MYRNLFVIALIGLGLFWALRFLERSMIYFPDVFPEGHWDTLPFSGNWEDCFFDTSDGIRLHGWFLESETPQVDARRTLLFFHGNGGNITHRTTNILHLLRHGLNVFIFDYRGYGKSEGTPSEQGLYLDALAAYEYLATRPDVSPAHLVLFGRSLGGAVALDLATKRPSEKLILESTFSSIKAMADDMFKGIPVHYLIQTKFDSLSKIRRIQVPLLVIHGNRDTLVPFAQGKRLFDEARAPKVFYEIDGADHLDTYEIGGAEYFECLTQFIYEKTTLSAD